jgi:hypothetical protein
VPPRIPHWGGSILMHSLKLATWNLFTNRTLANMLQAEAWNVLARGSGKATAYLATFWWQTAQKTASTDTYETTLGHPASAGQPDDHSDMRYHRQDQNFSAPKMLSTVVLRHKQALGVFCYAARNKWSAVYHKENGKEMFRVILTVDCDNLLKRNKPGTYSAACTNHW